MSKQDSLASCLAKMYESKFEHVAESGKPKCKTAGGSPSMDKRLNLLNEKMDKLLHFQEDVLGKLETVHHGMDVLEKEMDKLTKLQHWSFRSVNEKELNPGDFIQQSHDGHETWTEIIKLLKNVHEDTAAHREKLNNLEKVVSTMDKVVAFMGSTFRNSKVLDFILKGVVSWKKEAPDEAKDKSEEKEITKKTKHGRSNPAVLPEGQRSVAEAIKAKALGNPKGTEPKSQCDREPPAQGEDWTPSPEPTKPPDKDPRSKTCAHMAAGEGSGNPHTAPGVQLNKTTPSKGTDPRTEERPVETNITTATKNQPGTDSSITAPSLEVTHVSHGKNTENGGSAGNGQSQDPTKHNPVYHEVKGDVIKAGNGQASSQNNPRSEQSPESYEVTSEAQLRTCDTDTKETADLTKPSSVLQDIKEGESRKCVNQTPDLPEGATLAASSEPAANSEDFIVLDDCPPPPAPFNHRIVSIKQAILSSCYTVCQHEILGGGRFGQVHKCVEMSSGLRLAAKIIRVKGLKDRDEVKNEINIMNQLNHVNLIQLYDAFECKNDLTLIMEYLDGGELFDRITDENYNMTELDGIMFTKQICEGIYYLHQQYILHLDLKPENILCVTRTGNQIKIIDFGLARRYKPREKLKVNFGTPEFLAPEVVNYDFVSFPTDMWSIGVITYMLLSGLSPFLGESDAETMNYIVNCNWDFDSETFEEVSEEAKDFVSKLLVKEKSCRMSAGQCLKHEWLVNLPVRAKKYKVRLKSQILLQRYLMQRKWKKHFYVVTAANRLRKFQLLSLKPS